MLYTTPRCDTCGTQTKINVHICGRCANRWNWGAFGRKKINESRATNGLPPLQSSIETEGSSDDRG